MNLSWKKNKFCILLILLLVNTTVFLYAQNEIIEDTTYNTLTFPGSEDSGTIKPIPNPREPGSTKILLDTLEVKTSNNKILSKLYEAIIKNPSANPVDTNTQTTYQIPFQDIEDYIILDIQIVRLDPFGTNLYNLQDNSEQNKAHKKLGNTLHVKTNKKVIENYLLFQQGDKFNPYTVVENERLLRSVNYIEDAKINVLNINNIDKTLSIEIIVQDKWPIGIGWEASDIGIGSFDIFNQNILGFGHENKNTIYYRNDLFPRLGYKGNYRIKNLMGSFIDSRIEYTNNYGTNTWLLNFERNFFTSSLKYAGGLTIENTQTKTEVKLEDTVLNNEPLDFTKYDIWAGRSFPINLKRRDNSLNLFFTTRIYREDFFNRNELVKYNNQYRFHNKNVILAGIGISKQSFSESNLVYSFGRTEDIPFGVLASTTFGYEINEYSQRPYIGMKLAYGRFLPFKGYGYLRSEVGTFGGNKQPQQTTLRIEGRYFSKLLKSNMFRYRGFVSAEYVNGVYRFTDEFININNKSGIVGLKSDSLINRQKLIFNLEWVTFTPIHFYGFRLATFNYINLGFIGGNKENIFNAPLYTGIGIGIRLRNEHLVFPTLQIRLSYYPNIPPGSTIEQLEFSGESRLNFRNFYPKKPEIVQY